jgi:hypothetical protein
MSDSIAVAKLKREIARLRRLHQNRSIDEAEMEEVVEARKGSSDSQTKRFAQAFLETTRKQKTSIESELAKKTKELQRIIRSLPTARQTGRRGRASAFVDPERLYVDDIDSFRKVRSVRPEDVEHLLNKGHIRLTEEEVQTAIEEILRVPFHRKDWGGEINDLYTANTVVRGKRRATAFLLKGIGMRAKVMSIRDCGKRGDQIVRLFDSPADVVVVQSVGPIADHVIKDVQAKVAGLRATGRQASFMIMDGQDTARVLFAYETLSTSGRRRRAPMPNKRLHPTALGASAKRRG